ncbi:MAG TPA: transposase [Rhizobacter sp.]|nr:transposase [Rhizobacter sp.]
MARLPRLCVPGWPHLLTQTGHNRQPVFRDDADRGLFLDLLRESAASAGVVIHAYGLRDNEVRLLVTPNATDSLSRMMQALGRRYGSSFNRRHGHMGSLWEGRFRATVVEPEQHLLSCMRYTEDLGISVDASTQLGHVVWSSAAHHRGERTDPLVGDHLQYWSLGNTPFEREAAYREVLQQALTSQELAQIADAVAKGWPLGSRGFLERLAAATDRRVEPRPRGRPPKRAGNLAPIEKV